MANTVLNETAFAHDMRKAHGLLLDSFAQIGAPRRVLVNAAAEWVGKALVWASMPEERVLAKGLLDTIDELRKKGMDV